MATDIEHTAVSDVLGHLRSVKHMKWKTIGQVSDQI
jgi:hypothetical protein